MRLSVLPLLILLPFALSQDPPTTNTLPTLPGNTNTNTTLTPTNPANSTNTNSTIPSTNSTNSSEPAPTPLRPATIPTAFLSITAYAPGATNGAGVGIATGPNDNYIAAAGSLLRDGRVVGGVVMGLVGVVGMLVLV